mmetsp:Transcript_22945/g.35370  ORF Transcript_22945/g.35370 Transcript_22945/m.35370 type:complete len:162 (-) Transcript_22945:104-589(-)|eukprot:CAMPEP_0170493382 /NCGR_PEP_ID=MMETSP0208-20121228/13808_1 /TAXON_ID=197538 /ORGANISM="Strombidium inclinatum, Strain S3" /LENGTH=161 /DNA_ID=CAMNT_0010769307 /DNA_START=29 /DNA_END=517 /DNA_ORIENTATION=-
MDAKKIEELAGSTLLVKDGDAVKKVSVADFAKDNSSVKFLAFYAGAHWCPPCRIYTANLQEFYHSVNADGKKMEVIFMTDDRDQAHFDRHFAKMPWAAIPFGEDNAKNQFKITHCVDSLPSLVVISTSTWNVVNIGEERDSVPLKDKSLKLWEDNTTQIQS